MATRNPTYYEILGINSGAKHNEVGLAFNRKMAARRREDAPPDLKGETMLREAFEVLSDLDRRAEYDAKLRADMIKPAFAKGHALMAVGFIVAVGGGVYFYLNRPVEPPVLIGKTYQEILNDAIPAVGRLQTLDMGGQGNTAGVAFAVLEGTLVTSCQGHSPTAVMSVSMGKREIPAKVTMADEGLGLCKLEANGVGTWPLSVSQQPAKAADRVYAVQVTPKGDVLLREGMVTAVKRAENASLLVVNIPVPAQHGGAPLLDVHGRVVAVVNIPPEGKGAYVALPKSWGDPPPPPSKEPPKPAAPDPSEVDKTGGVDDLKLPGGRRPAQTEREKRLEKAFRPPPTVPDDI
jgi:hypothetical protein